MTTMLATTPQTSSTATTESAKVKPLVVTEVWEVAPGCPKTSPVQEAREQEPFTLQVASQTGQARRRAAHSFITAIRLSTGPPVSTSASPAGYGQACPCSIAIGIRPWCPRAAESHRSRTNGKGMEQ